MPFVDTRYSIPPDASTLVKVTRTRLRCDRHGLFTHMHVRGKAMSFSATTPDGKTERLLTIPNYNFEWQLYAGAGRSCRPREPLECVSTTTRRSTRSILILKKTVRDGPQTYQEMMNGFMFTSTRMKSLDRD